VDARHCAINSRRVRNNFMKTNIFFSSTSLVILMLAAACPAAVAQDRLPTMPRYDRYEKLRQDIYSAVTGGDVQVQWAEDGGSFTYLNQGKFVRYDLASGKESPAKDENSESIPASRQQRRIRNVPARGRQYDTVYSPDGKLKAFYKDQNVHIANLDGSGVKDITTEGSVQSRIKLGMASWVYGEELGVREAMWWSPNSNMLAFYRFDESKVPDYYIAMDQIAIQDRLDTEAYPKAGAPNPQVELFVYDLAKNKLTKINTHFGQNELGEYVYDVRWAPDGSELLFNRTNRKQNQLQFCAADPSTGKSRVVVEEQNPRTWTENHPRQIWLLPQQGKPARFLWLSERNGYRNIYLGDMSGGPLHSVTQHQFEVQAVVAADEKAGYIFYTARDGDNPYKMQLHRIRFNGRDDVRMTDPALSHAVQLAPGGKHFVDVAQDLTTPPTSTLRDENGKLLATIGKSDTTKFEALRLKKAERITFKAADGVTDLYGYVTFPSDFDAKQKYPLLVSVYGGPESGSGVERFQLPNPISEMGFVTAWFDGRGTSGRGKAFADAVYGKLGVVEIDDQAAGAKYLSQRAYIDGSRVGIYGTSYGGYASTMCLLRHPEAFAVAVASSPVTDWRNYDSIYTERYMGLPSEGENKAGYDAGSAITYARNLKGRLMLYYGTADNNVHPSNTFQLVHALQQLGKSFDVMVGPDQEHSGINANRMWEYFIDNLILNHSKAPLATAWKLRQKRLQALAHKGSAAS
jgi:dipeptidyl-peptidase-4